jgi:hypothetical protein
MTTLKKSSYWLSVATLGIILGLSIQFTKAWTEPTAIAPNGNVGAPINTGDNSQYKAGAFGIGKVLHGYSNAVFDGNVGIGTTAPQRKLDVRGHIRQDTNDIYDIWIQGAGTDGGRNLALMGYKSTDRLYLNYGGEYAGGVNIGGNVGIGTNPSSERLNVSGNARVSGSVNATSFCNASGGNCVNSLRNTTVYSINPACVDGGKLTLNSTCNAIDGACSDYGTVCYNCTRISKDLTRCNNSVAGYLTR